MADRRRDARETVQLVTEAELPDNNEEGWMRYESNATGLTFNIDMKRHRHWMRVTKAEEAEDAKDAKDDRPRSYPAHADANVAVKLLPKMPGFLHLDTPRYRARGESAHVAMAVNGLSLVDAWSRIAFVGMIQDAGRYTSQQDRPTCSILRSGMQTIRNTGPFHIDALDIIVFIPPQLRRVDEFGGAFRHFYAPRRTKDNGLFILMPAPLGKAIDYLLLVSGQHGNEILDKFEASYKGGPPPPDARPAVAEEKEGDGGERARVEEKRDADPVAAPPAAAASDSAAASASAASSSSSGSSSSSALLAAASAKSKSSRSAPTSTPTGSTPKGPETRSKRKHHRIAKPAEDGKDAKEDQSSAGRFRHEPASGARGAPGGGGDDDADDHIAHMRGVARRLLLSRFFAGRALHPADPGANFVLEIHGTQYG